MSLAVIVCLFVFANEVMGQCLPYAQQPLLTATPPLPIFSLPFASQQLLATLPVPFANPLLPAASPVSAIYNPVSACLPPALPCGCSGCTYLRKIVIPPPCI